MSAWVARCPGRFFRNSFTIAASNHPDVNVGPVETTVQAVNLGTGVSWDAKDIVHFMSRLLGRDLVIDTDPAKVRKSDRPNLQASTRRLEMMLPGFETKSLMETLGATLVAEGFELAPAGV